MIYPSDFEQRIGFDKLRAETASLCHTAAARELVEAAPFLTHFPALEQTLGQTAEMRTIQVVESEFPQAGYSDLLPLLNKARIEGTYLEVDQIHALGRALELIDGLSGFFASKRDDNDRSPYPRLDELVRPIESFAPVRREADRIIDPQSGQMRDNASPELAAIRQEITRCERQLGRRLQTILRQAQAEGIVESDATPTLRDGRAVIPVAAGNKRKIKGLVHDESATGRTAYIEPIEVVELNNELKELENAERREIIRILALFTDLLRPRLPALHRAADYLAAMDFLQAKARYALGMDGVLPQLSPKAVIDLQGARHPLLERSLKREGKAIVPLDLRITPERHILLISGPNAGGKSVCLKSVGLLQYMLQCGWLVPAKEYSTFGIFEHIFIDIGDQQSLENDLSTYSSHLQNMKTVLRSADERSLVLIDEFGTGTEPSMGGAIAEAILEQLEERRVRAVITTHYANLKYYAAGSAGIVNGAMTFDLQKITPLFRLEMGRPGSSFAFEIARKIGLPEELIARAGEKIGTQQVNVERQIREAARDKRYWERKRETIRQTEKQIEQTTERYEKQLAEIRAERQRILDQARDEARQLLADTNRQIEHTIREIRESQADKERTRAARNEFDRFRDRAEEAPTDLALEQKMQKLRERQQRRAERRSEQSPAAAPAAPKPVELAPGVAVRLKGQQTIGQVIGLQGNKVTVAFNQLTSTVDRSKLETLSNNEARREQRSSYTPPPRENYDTMKKRLTFSTQIDLRGMRVAEALEQVEHYIDEAVMLGFNQVRILHGKGTGAIKEEVRRYLRTHPLVASTKDEHEEQGGAGITVVTLEL